MTTRRGSRGGAGAPPTPTPATAAVPLTTSPAPRNLFGIKSMLVGIALLVLLLWGVESSGGFLWGLSVSFGIPLLLVGLYFGWPFIKKLGGSLGKLLWLGGFALLAYGFWWAFIAVTPGSPENRFGTPDSKLWFWQDANPAVNAAGEANYWVLFEPNQYGVKASFVHKALPEMAPCLLPTNVISASAGATSIEVCNAGPKGLPYFDGTPQLRALAETIRSCANCSWLTGRLKPGGIEEAPEEMTIDSSVPNWRQFNTGPEDVGHGNCFIIRPFTINIDDVVRMRYRDVSGGWHDYSPDEVMPGREYILATAFQMLNHSPLPVAYEISQRKPLNLWGGGNSSGQPYVCLRAS